MKARATKYQSDLARNRVIKLLRVNPDMSNKELGEVCGVAAATVRIWRKRGLK